MVPHKLLEPCIGMLLPSGKAPPGGPLYFRSSFARSPASRHLARAKKEGPWLRVTGEKGHFTATEKGRKRTETEGNEKNAGIKARMDALRSLHQHFCQ